MLMKRMIYTTKFISVLVFIALMLAACNKDEWKDDVDALKQPMPTGIVIMDAVSVTAVKGTSFQLRFRVNPSGVAVTEGNLELDLQNSDTYLLVPPTRSAFSAQSRASYVTPSDCYKITGVEPDRNGSGEILDGQWIVTIKTQGEGNFRNVSDLYLVMNYTDAAGVAHKVSSPVLPVQIVPTADEGVEFRYSLVQTLRTAHGELNPYILYTDVNTYRNASGGEWVYDISFITKAESQGEAMTLDWLTLHEKQYVSLIPKEGYELWTSLEEGKEKKVSTASQVAITDFGSTQKIIDLPITYCPRTVIIRRDMPIAELNANRDDIDYVIDLSAEAAEYGLTADMASHLTRRPTSIDFHGVFIDNFGIDEINTVGEDNTFVLQASPFIPDELTAGFITADADAAIANYILHSFPQYGNPLDKDTFQFLLDMEIRILINGVE